VPDSSSYERMIEVGGEEEEEEVEEGGEEEVCQEAGQGGAGRPSAPEHHQLLTVGEMGRRSN
jgi:hypothetical protein